MRAYQYLGDNGYTLRQRELFERQRFCAIHEASKGHVTVISLARMVGAYEAHKVLEALRLDGYLIRYHHSPTGETRYKVNPSALNNDAFYLQEPYPREI